MAADARPARLASAAARAGSPGATALPLHTNDLVDRLSHLLATPYGVTARRALYVRGLGVVGGRLPPGLVADVPTAGATYLVGIDGGCLQSAPNWSLDQLIDHYRAGARD